MIRCLSKEEEVADLEVQYVVCEKLVRACRQALFELALEEDCEPHIKQMAVQAMKSILDDWSRARADVGRELVIRGKLLPPVNRR